MRGQREENSRKENEGRDRVAQCLREEGFPRVSELTFRQLTFIFKKDPDPLKEAVYLLMERLHGKRKILAHRVNWYSSACEMAGIVVK